MTQVLKSVIKLRLQHLHTCSTATPLFFHWFLMLSLQYRAPYMPPTQQYPVTSSTSYFPGTSPAEYSAYGKDFTDTNINNQAQPSASLFKGMEMLFFIFFYPSKPSALYGLQSVPFVYKLSVLFLWFCLVVKYFQCFSAL